MFIAGVLLFSLIVPVVSYVVSKPEHADRGKLATSTAVLAWSSLLMGLFLSRVSH